jgi:hypothetical protein
LAVALVPTIIHNYVGAKVEDGLRASDINTTLAGFPSNPTNRRAAWVKDTFDSHDWMERRYIGTGGENILLFAARSYDLKRLYHHPEIGILRGVDLEKEEIKRLPGMPDVPVHALKSRMGNRLAAYVLLYNGQFIKNPIQLQFLTSVELLYSPRKPMTLLFVYDSQSRNDAPFEQSPAARILAAAVNNFLSQRQHNIGPSSAE